MKMAFSILFYVGLMSYIPVTVFRLHNIEKYQTTKYIGCGTDFHVPQANLTFYQEHYVLCWKQVKQWSACKIYTLSII